MSPTPTVLVVCLLVIAACEANLLPYESKYNGDLQPRQLDIVSLLKGLLGGVYGPLLGSVQDISTPLPLCGTCSFKDVKLDGLMKALGDLGPALQKATDMLGAAVKELLTELKDLKVAIQKVVQSIRDSIGPVLDKLSTAAAHIVTCPALTDLLKNLKVHLYAILDILANRWYPLINQPDVQSLLAALSEALIIALPDIIKLLRDMLYNLLQVLQMLGLGLCDLLGPLIWKLLDPIPSGTVYILLEKIFISLGGKGALELLTKLLGGIPNLLGMLSSAEISNPSTLGGTLITLICNLLKTLGLGSILPCDKLLILPLLG